MDKTFINKFSLRSIFFQENKNFVRKNNATFFNKIMSFVKILN